MTIRDITPILVCLADVCTPEQIDAWLHTPHVLLDGLTPVALIEAGGYDEVLALARQLDGVYL